MPERRLVLDTPDAVADAAAAAVAGYVADNERSSIGLAGGSTPEATYERLAVADVAWDRTTLWLNDERWVPEDHPDSNAGMVRRALRAGGSRLVAPDHGIGDPHEAAAAYERTVTAVFAGADPQGRPGLVLLGIGEDGHTASLFPDSGALEVMDRTYVAVWVAHLEAWRLTATFRLLLAARHVWFLVTGEAKAPALARVLNHGEPLPAQRVAVGAGSVTWFLDAAAASMLA